MADRDCSRLSWPSKPSSSPEIEVHVRGVPLLLNKKLLAAKSDKLAVLFENGSYEEISSFLNDGAEPETFELIARFCHGFELKFSNENIVPIICLAVYLGMSENRSTNNLIRQAVGFFQEKILPSWNETIKTLLHMEMVGQESEILGLTNACLESIVSKVMANPHLLRKPMTNSELNDSIEIDEDEYRPSTRRKLFVHDSQSEDLTILPLKFYEPIIRILNIKGAPPESVASSLCQYARRWIYSTGENESLYVRKSQREVIQAVQRSLPNEYGLLPCALLFEMLRLSIELEASFECRDGFEIRIGKQLDQATVQDLLIPLHGYARETKYDISCVKRIYKHFHNGYDKTDASRFMRVADLIGDFIAELANDTDLEASIFISLTELLAAASLGNHHDGLYRAIDIYFDKHKHLTESEREEICRMLDCQKMSPEACEHAAQNVRLPMRVVLKVLFLEQLKLRDAVAQELHSSVNLLKNGEEEEEEEEEDEAKGGCSDKRLITEMERVNSKVIELEKECCMMKKEIENGCCHKRAKVSVWGAIKRKFGCNSSTHNCDCHVKKKKMHPRRGFSNS